MMELVLGEVTTELYWDCACSDNYITPKYVSVCQRCLAHKDDMPDSMLNEVAEMVLNIAHGHRSTYNG